MIDEVPLVSCICVTSRRIRLLKRAIECFQSQTYNNKELIVSYPLDDILTKHVLIKLASQKDFKIIPIERPNHLSLGAARNHAIGNANGEYICNWDDDDWYHPERLTIQLHFLLEAGISIQACVLNQVILYDEETRKAHLSFLYPWENTIVFRKGAFSEFQYSDKHKGEDSHIMDLLEAKQRLCYIGGAAELYIYIYHSGNTWGRTHFQSFIKRSIPLPADSNHVIASNMNY